MAVRQKHGRQSGFSLQRMTRVLLTSLTILSSLMAASALCGCVVVGASSRGGFFIWPGGLGLVVLILLVVLALRRR